MPHLMNRIRVDHRELFGDIDLERQRQRFGGKRRILAPSARTRPKASARNSGKTTARPA